MFRKLKVFSICLLAVVMLAGAADTADAKRFKFKFKNKSQKSRSVPVIIPLRVGGSSNVVFVHELPDVEAFQFKGKGYFDLGYKHGFLGRAIGSDISMAQANPT